MTDPSPKGSEEWYIGYLHIEIETHEVKRVEMLTLLFIEYSNNTLNSFDYVYYLSLVKVRDPFDIYTIEQWSIEKDTLLADLWSQNFIVGTYNKWKKLSRQTRQTLLEPTRGPTLYTSRPSRWPWSYGSGLFPSYWPGR